MKKHKFLSERFLDEVQAERAELMRQIQLPEHALTPVNFTDEEKQVAMLFANRLTWLLYQGGRISLKDYLNDTYVLWHHTEQGFIEKDK